MNARTTKEEVTKGNAKKEVGIWRGKKERNEDVEGNSKHCTRIVSQMESSK